MNASTLPMKRVVVESPLSGYVARNEAYARLVMRDCLRRGEAPFLSHLLFTQCLDDTVPEERELGMKAGFAWGDVAEITVVYVDFGTSGGMQMGIDRAYAANRITVWRQVFAQCCDRLWWRGPSGDEIFMVLAREVMLLETETRVGWPHGLVSTRGETCAFCGEKLSWPPERRFARLGGR